MDVESEAWMILDIPTHCDYGQISKYEGYV